MSIHSISRWDSSVLPQEDRYAAWQHMLKSTWGSWDVQKPSGPDFQASISSQAVDALRIVHCVCDPCSATRGCGAVTKDAADDVTIQLVLSGSERFAIEDRRTLLTPGDILIWTSLKAMRFEVVERLAKVSVTIPLARLRGWLPNSWHSMQASLPHLSPSTGLLSAFMRQLVDADASASIQSADAVTEVMLGLMVNALGGDLTDREASSIRHQQLQAVKRFIETHLDDPDIKPAQVAAANRISLRYLHALFESEGTTVQQHIIQRRLDRCRRDLSNPAMRHRTVTEIAFAWGFQNSTHFSRRFKAAYGQSPTEHRDLLVVQA
ncbi:helix-turn-helix domain-containing protein [Lichenicoccus roseus]|uniref:helix-turn-helix domain-containing protein n=1 Tax=Lichenicoccus roseus TaxID=2683649 RepID=UPI001486694D|nr:helix-turn-helix domain-containing protein [Lichenicoccus roseus]